MHSISYINITQNTHNLNTGKQNYFVLYLYLVTGVLIKEFYMNKLRKFRC